MPLNTEIHRNGEARTDFRWGQFHVAAMIVACMFENPDKWDGAKPNDGIDYPTEPQPLAPGDVFKLVCYPVIEAAEVNGYTLTRDHRFEDVTDGEVFELLAGDEFHAYRDHS